jgi:hypothetical protein
MKCTDVEGIQNFKELYVELNDNSVYKLICDKGHESIVFIQEQKFEILFEMGTMALLDGYTREAVSSIAAAIERFYEFCIQVFVINKGIDYEVFEKTWKLMKSQSERQIGALLVPRQILFLKSLLSLGIT